MGELSEQVIQIDSPAVQAAEAGTSAHSKKKKIKPAVSRSLTVLCAILGALNASSVTAYPLKKTTSSAQLGGLALRRFECQVRRWDGAVGWEWKEEGESEKKVQYAFMRAMAFRSLSERRAHRLFECDH